MALCHHEDCKHCERELSRNVTIDDLAVMSREDLSRYLEIRDGWLKAWADWADGLVQHHDPLTRFGHQGLRDAIALRCSSNDPIDFDATDGAHPAWWRGHHHGFDAAIREIEKVLSDPFRTLTNGGHATNAEWQALRFRIGMLALNFGCIVAELAELRGQVDPKVKQPPHAVYVVTCGSCHVRVGVPHLDTCEFKR